MRYVEEAPVQSAPQHSEQPRQNVTIINNYYNQSASTPMSNANTLFGR